MGMQINWYTKLNELDHNQMIKIYSKTYGYLHTTWYIINLAF